MEPKSAASQAPRHMAAPIRILLVEDNPADAMLIQEFLGIVRGFFYSLTRATSLAESQKLIAACSPGNGNGSEAPPTPFDVILLDLSLPDSRGYETFQSISDCAPETPVILLTGIDDENLAVQAIRQGAQDYLVKSELTSAGAMLARAIRYAIERKRGEEALRVSQERYMLAMQGANDGLWDWDLKTNQVYFSPRWKAMLGFMEGELAGVPEEWLHRIHVEDIQRVRVMLTSHLNGHSELFESEYRIRHKDGSYRWVLTRGLALRDDSGAPHRMAGSQTDITARKETEEQLIHDALHDTLTGLPNRALFLDRLGRAIEYKKRRDEYLYAVLFLDLDRFKVINDSLGHSVGDQILVACAQRLGLCLRSGDTVSRLGGDEFVILLDDIKQVDDASEIAGRIQQALKTPLAVNSHKVTISASIGIVPASSQALLEYEYPQEILRDADIAMYQAKMTGKACHAIFDSSMRNRAVARLELENDLREALENTLAGLGEFTVHYQPIISLQTWRLSGFEALLRWDHPTRGSIPPKQFIPIAEETGLIYDLGIWVLRQACRQMRVWQDRYPINPPLTIHVNISGKQLSQSSLADEVSQVLQETGLDPRYLSLEITESLFVENDETFNETLQRLTQSGIKLQIDDFGTGYSSFSYLQRLPVSSIKIDATFINKMEDHQNHAEIVRSIVTLARSLGLKAIAEGVETQEQLAHLQKLGCRFGQGFYISSPVSSDTASELIRLSRQTGRLKLPS
jgi:diguanylate cyclase (GGDEF)-like protein/PAS domain S-box-containing protein